MSGWRFRLSGEVETAALGRCLGERAPAGAVFALVGPLGAGKTRFVKGLAEGLGIDPDDVVSPTFTMLAVLSGRRTLFHMDWYRMASREDLETVGCDEAFAAGGVCAVEWADRVPEAVPPDAIRMDFTLEPGETRTVVLRGGESVLKEDFSFPAPLRAERIP